MSNHNKYQSSKIAGIVLIAISIIMVTSFVLAGGILAATVGKEYPFIIFLPSFGLFLPLIPLALGIFILVRSAKGSKVMKNGKKVPCEIFRILRVKNGYEMVIKYYGESGQDYRLSVPVSYSTAIEFKEGMYVECYVSGEDAFLDTNNLREVEKPLD